MGSIAERPVLRLLAITQVVISVVLDFKPDRSFFDLEVNILVGACSGISDLMRNSKQQTKYITIAQWLALAFTAETP